MMKLTYDHEDDALYVKLVEGERVSRTEQLDTGTLVDLDRFGRVLGIEVIRPARRWPLEECSVSSACQRRTLTGFG